MSRQHNRKGRSKNTASFVKLDRYIMRTEAWAALSANAKAAYVEIRYYFNGINNGDIFLSQRDLAARLNIGKTAARNALLDLQDKGFIRVRRKGAFDWKVKYGREDWDRLDQPEGHPKCVETPTANRHKMRATTFILTEEKFAGETSKDFVRWRRNGST